MVLLQYKLFYFWSLIDFTFTSFQIRNDRINAGEKPFECDNHKKFAMTISLKTHMRNHTVEFICDYEYFGAHIVHLNSLSPVWFLICSTRTIGKLKLRWGGS